MPPSYDVTARIWLNASPVSTANNSVAITAGGRECWTAQINRTLTTAGIPVSFYNASLLPSSNPACEGGDLDITIDGRPAGATSQWSRFWRDSLFSPAARPLNQSSDAFLSSVDLEVPPFLGISGQAVEAGTVTPETVSTRQLVPDGTEVRAFVGTTACGSTKTKTLTTSTGGFGGNIFGLIVPPASVKPGCGTPGAAVSFCVGEFKARQPAAGPWSSVQSPEAKPVQWAAPALADITPEPTAEPCVGGKLRYRPSHCLRPAALPSSFVTRRESVTMERRRPFRGPSRRIARIWRTRRFRTSFWRPCWRCSRRPRAARLGVTVVVRQRSYRPDEICGQREASGSGVADKQGIHGVYPVGTVPVDIHVVAECPVRRRVLAGPIPPGLSLRPRATREAPSLEQTGHLSRLQTVDEHSR